MWVANEARPGLRWGGLQLDWGLLGAVVALNGLAGALCLLRCLLTGITPLCLVDSYDVRGKLELGQLPHSYHACIQQQKRACQLVEESGRRREPRNWNEPCSFGEVMFTLRCASGIETRGCRLGAVPALSIERRGHHQPRIWTKTSFERPMSARQPKKAAESTQDSFETLFLLLQSVTLQLTLIGCSAAVVRLSHDKQHHGHHRQSPIKAAKATIKTHSTHTLLHLEQGHWKWNAVYAAMIEAPVGEFPCSASSLMMAAIVALDALRANKTRCCLVFA